jgi:hypothetical protein
MRGCACVGALARLLVEKSASIRLIFVRIDVAVVECEGQLLFGLFMV